ncbi:N-acetylgalactosamine 6-sulfate sulfatase [Sphingorhabdus lutea]|uniref:N-acetylgalactosamine 6-sulfate sulfatase n=1 Tax=Sphingorhabdus lutea TaxID=1913578 RepID=A0A1L3JEQ3_9SPHN|nr:N-acetylgalactosamine 6-sulfate sulfatase [Sphingorhabdus lutea]
MTDDQGYADVGFNGSRDIPTPNIDRIANEGVRFERGYVTFPVCGPSRAGLLTGRYQSRFGFDLNPSENPLDPKAGLPASEKTIASILKPAGYKSSIIGKWHMGNHKDFHPMDRGFDEFFGFQNGGHNYFAERFRDIKMEDTQNTGQQYNSLLVRNRNSVETKGYLTDILSDEAVDFVARKKDEPFFLYLAYNAPHVPMHASQKYLDRFDHIKDPQRKTYAAMISAVDDGVGKLLNKLDELNLAEDTIIFFLSDNGGPQAKAKNGSVNLPLRGGKGDVFEGGVRVPFAMRWTGTISAGIVYPHPVSSLDILATAVGVNNINMARNNPLDGVNLIPFLLDKNFTKQPHETLFWRYRSADRNSYSFGRIAALQGDDKYLQIEKNKMLYNVRQDISEQHNLFGNDKKKAAELEAKYLKWHKEMSDLQISIFNEWPIGSTE